MVDQQAIEKQLKKIDFNPHGWNRGEVAELHNIILPDEEIYECVNGLYEGGFALLVASNIRVLLVDQKPFGYLNVEDLRFDMINEIDYSHRLLIANIKIATGNKTLLFRSYNKERLRKLIGHVQHCMAESKTKQSTQAEDQKQHLEQINQQLQTYLLAQHKEQQKLQQHLIDMQSDKRAEPPKFEAAEMSEDLKNYLYAQGLLSTYSQTTGRQVEWQAPAAASTEPQPTMRAGAGDNNQLEEIYADGIKEVFGKQHVPANHSGHGVFSVFEVNPFKVAVSKLPLASLSRKFGISLPSLPLWPITKSDDQTLNLNSTTSSEPIM